MYSHHIFRIITTITIIIVAIISIVIFSQSSSKEITSEEAKNLAIHKVYPKWDKIKQHYTNIDIVLDVEKDLFGNYIVHVCDLNIECMCRPNEGYWVKVAKDGSSVSIIKQNLCPYG